MVTKAIKEVMDTVKPENRWTATLTPTRTIDLRTRLALEEHRDHRARADMQNAQRNWVTGSTSAQLSFRPPLPMRRLYGAAKAARGL